MPDKTKRREGTLSGSRTGQSVRLQGNADFSWVKMTRRGQKVLPCRHQEPLSAGTRETEAESYRSQRKKKKEAECIAEVKMTFHPRLTDLHSSHGNALCEQERGKREQQVQGEIKIPATEEAATARSARE